MRLRVLILIVGVAFLAMPGASFAATADEPATMTSASASEEFETAAWNGLWYSRYLLDHVALFSGLGATFIPPDAHLDALAELAEAASAPTLFVPDDAVYLEAVFAGTETVQSAEPREGGFDVTSDDPRLTPAVQAMAIAVETEWAKLINSGSWASQAGAESGAGVRLRGQLYMMGAKAKADFALVNLRDDAGNMFEADWLGTGVVLAVEAEADLTDQLLMLRALSDLILTVSSSGPHAEAYADEAFEGWFADGATAIFDQVSTEPPSTAREASEAIQAFGWYAATLPDTARAGVIDAMGAHAQFLALSERGSVLDLARRVRGLSEFGTYTGDADMIDAADRLAGTLLSSLEEVLGEEHSALSVWEVGELIGSLNAYRRAASEPGWQQAAEAALAKLIDDLVSTSGMLPAIPQPDRLDPAEASGMPDAWLGHPDITRTDDLPPIFLAEVSLDAATDRWRVTSTRFDTGGALYTAVELLRVGDLVPYFAPLVPAQSESQPTTQAMPAAEIAAPAGPLVIEIESEDFGFAPFDSDIPAGSEVVLRLTNRGVAPHNVDIPDLGVIVEANGGETTEVTFTAPDEVGEYSFLCNIAGHIDLGMKGTLSIVAPLAQPAASTAAGSAGPDTAAEGAILLPPGEINETVNFTIPALIFAAGLPLATLVFIVGMLRFVKLVDED